MAEGGRVFGIGVHANGRAEDAAGHGTPLVNVAKAGGGVERGTGCFIGVVFEAVTICLGVAETACLWIARKVSAVLADPCLGAAFKGGGEIWVFGAQSFHASGEALGIEFVDGKGSMAALRAAGAADEPGACAACRIG